MKEVETTRVFKLLVVLNQTGEQGNKSNTFEE